MKPSSDQLHPVQGARFVFTRVDNAYDVEVFVAGGTTVTTQVRWDSDGAASFFPEVGDSAVREQLLKLARVAKRTGQARLTRWRG